MTGAVAPEGYLLGAARCVIDAVHDRSDERGVTDGRVRPARADEADTLRALAHRSKAHWPYDAAFLERVAPMLVLTPMEIERDEVHVLEVDGRVAGWHRVSVHGDDAELEDLWVEPHLIGAGWGRVLFSHAVDIAHSHDAAALEWDADPYAQPFYERMGGVEVGRTPSAAEEGRMLPRMRLDLSERLAQRRLGPHLCKYSELDPPQPRLIVCQPTVVRGTGGDTGATARHTAQNRIDSPTFGPARGVAPAT